MASLTQKYEPLPTDASTASDEISRELPTKKPFRYPVLYLGWVLSAIFALLMFFHGRKCSPCSSPFGNFGTGFRTEFAPVLPSIRLKNVQFWGGPRWFDNGTGYRLNNPAEPLYVGPPSDEMDEAWHALTHGRYFTITEEEAVATWGKNHGLSDNPSIGFSAGLDAFHALHCLDELRKALDKNHYYHNRHIAFPDRGHRDHCIDHIRQQLMCHADLTPNPVIYYPGHGRDFVQSDVVHTCRDWDMIKNWLNGRAEITKTVQDANADRYWKEHPEEKRPEEGASEHHHLSISN